MSQGPPDAGRRGSMRRAVDGALDATVGRVGRSVTEVAVDATGATVEQVIEEIEPYLVEEAIPRIVDGVTPYLSQTVVPAILEDLTPRLVEELLPRILTDLRPYLEAELVPAVVDGLVPHLNESVAPELIDALMPKIREEIAPQLVESLMPMIEEQVAPQLIEALMPMIQQEMAPQLIDALMPKIEQEIAPQLVESLMPMIEEQVAPQLVDALMPKIRQEVVPTIMDDIIDDPAVRDLIREQSQGLFLDALEGFRGTLADLDTVVDRVGRRLLRRGPRPEQPTALALVLDQESEEDSRPLRLAVADLAETRAMWRDLPLPPAPPGRSFTYGGAVTRLLGLAIDVSVVGWVAGQGLSALINLLDSLFGTLPSWLVAAFSLLAASLIPIYLALAYWATGRTLGMAVTGLRVCTPDGRRPGFVRSVARSWVGMLLLVVWLITGLVSLFDSKRRSVLDMLVHTEVRYSVPETQQRRHIRDALQEMREQPAKPERSVSDNPPTGAPDGPAGGGA